MSSRKNAVAPEPVEENKRFVSVTLTAVAAGNYSAGDIISNDADDTEGDAIEVELSETYGVKEIAQIVAVCSEDSILARLRLHFYNANPAAADVELDDNIAADFAKTATGAGQYIGSITLPAFADLGTAMSVAEAELLDKQLALASTLSKVYMVVEIVDAEANETAGMTIRFDIYFR